MQYRSGLCNMVYMTYSCTKLGSYTLPSGWMVGQPAIGTDRAAAQRIPHAADWPLDARGGRRTLPVDQMGAINEIRNEMIAPSSPPELSTFDAHKAERIAARARRFLPRTSSTARRTPNTNSCGTIGEGMATGACRVREDLSQMISPDAILLTRRRRLAEPGRRLRHRCGARRALTEYRRVLTRQPVPPVRC